MSDERKFSQGGIARGPDGKVATIALRYVAEPSPDGNGRPGVIFADECFISKDRVCTRQDNLHAAVPGAVRTRRERWWICPLHDGKRP